MRAGEKVAPTGPAGSGKSQLIRLAAGLAAPETGRVRVWGADPCALSSRDRAAAVLLLGLYAPIQSGSLRRALTLGLRRRPEDSELADVAARVGLGEAIRRLGGLDGALTESGGNLSDGERAMLGLARLALSPEPIALVDALDAHLDASGRALLAELLATRPGAVLCALRDPNLSDGFARRWSLEDGRAGSPALPESDDPPAAARRPPGDAEPGRRDRVIQRTAPETE